MKEPPFPTVSPISKKKKIWPRKNSKRNRNNLKCSCTPSLADRLI